MTALTHSFRHALFPARTRTNRTNKKHYMVTQIKSVAWIIVAVTGYDLEQAMENVFETLYYFGVSRVFRG